MNKYLITQPSWALPVLYQLCRDLRELGEKVRSSESLSLCLFPSTIEAHLLLFVPFGGTGRRPPLLYRSSEEPCFVRRRSETYQQGFHYLCDGSVSSSLSLLLDAFEVRSRPTTYARSSAVVRSSSEPSRDPTRNNEGSTTLLG